MTLDQLRQAYRAQPFRAFTICLADGRRLAVRHPECLLIPPQASRTIVVAGRGEDYKIIDLLLVTSIDFGSGKNGKKRTR